MTRRKQKSDRAHSIALQEMATGNERAKRNGSLFLDLLLGAFILTPLAILAYASYFGDLEMYARTKLFFLVHSFYNFTCRNLSKTTHQILSISFSPTLSFWFSILFFSILY